MGDRVTGVIETGLTVIRATGRNPPRPRRRGHGHNMEYGEAAGFNDGKNTDFWIDKKRTVVPTHVAFEASNGKQMEAFYKAALAAGGKDNGGPGYRDYSPGYYAAFVYDPDGNNIEAVWYDYSKAK